jgi:hypothetical protein
MKLLKFFYIIYIYKSMQCSKEAAFDEANRMQWEVMLTPADWIASGGSRDEIALQLRQEVQLRQESLAATMPRRRARAIEDLRVAELKLSLVTGSGWTHGWAQRLQMELQNVVWVTHDEAKVVTSQMQLERRICLMREQMYATGVQKAKDQIELEIKSKGKVASASLLTTAKDVHRRSVEARQLAEGVLQRWERDMAHIHASTRGFSRTEKFPVNNKGLAESRRCGL